MRRHSENADRIKRAARQACAFGTGSALAGVLLIGLGVDFTVMFMAVGAGTLAYGLGFYEGEAETVERIRSYMHRWGDR